MARPAKPRRLPLIGWSVAAQRFRELAEAGELGDSILLVGDPGTGKKTFAAAYRYFYRDRYKKSLEVVELNPGTTSLPGRCIAISNHPAAYCRRTAAGGVASRVDEAGLRHLDTGKLENIPDKECEFEPLSDAVVARFAQKWYLPPLRRRLIDALALLHFYGSRVFPGEGTRVRSVESDLIHQLLLDRSWVGNVAGLLATLRRTAEGGVLRRGSATDFPMEAGVPKHLPHTRFDWEGAGTWDGRCEVPIDALPKVATSVFGARFFIENGDSPEELPPSPFPRLGSAQLWPTNPDWPQGVDPARATSDDLMRAMAGPAGAGPLPEEFTRDVSSFTTLGATVESLRSGFAVTPDSIPDPLLREMLGKKPRATPKRNAKGPRLTDAENEVCNLYREYNGNQAAIARHRGTTPASVSQLVKSARDKLTPEQWKKLCGRNSHSFDRKVVGKRARTQRLPKDFVDPKTVRGGEDLLDGKRLDND